MLSVERRVLRGPACRFRRLFRGPPQYADCEFLSLGLALAHQASRRRRPRPASGSPTCRTRGAGSAPERTRRRLLLRRVVSVLLGTIHRRHERARPRQETCTARLRHSLRPTEGSRPRGRRRKARAADAPRRLFRHDLRPRRAHREPQRDVLGKARAAHGEVAGVGGRPVRVPRPRKSGVFPQPRRRVPASAEARRREDVRLLHEGQGRPPPPAEAHARVPRALR
mmetsp:Transcript_27143/g.83340  ORF Transcript_27143/g.83340 Transcript_27143/m.83340 type:complete len:225 (+) Transcript_27143:806-1480(+)